MKLSWNGIRYKTFKRQSHKMVKHPQTIRRVLAEELLKCAWPFCRVIIVKWIKKFLYKLFFILPELNLLNSFHFLLFIVLFKFLIIFNRQIIVDNV